MFRTTLNVAHVDTEKWKLTAPLVWEGGWQFVVIRSGFETDFASIPKPVRWLLDTAGRNSEAGVLHDAAWRESRLANPRIDPWFADGMFRRALRETGASTLTRSLMWFAVRLAAMAGGRFGHRGPRWPVKIFQLFGIFLLGCAAALGPTIVASVGLVVFLACNWIVAIVWNLVYERRHGGATNWPWPVSAGSVVAETPPANRLLVMSFAKDPTTPDASEPPAAEVAMAAQLRAVLDAGRSPTETQLDEWLASMLRVRA